MPKRVGLLSLVIFGGDCRRFLRRPGADPNTHQGPRYPSTGCGETFGGGRKAHLRSELGPLSRKHGQRRRQPRA